MNSCKQILMEIIRRPRRSLLLFLAAAVITLCCVAGCFLDSISESFYRIFAGVTGYGIAVELDGYTEPEMWETTIARILENPHILSYNNEIEAVVECEPVDFSNVSYDGTVHAADEEDGYSDVCLYGYLDISCSDLFRNGKLVLAEGDYPTSDALIETVEADDQCLDNSEGMIEAENLETDVKEIGVKETDRSGVLIDRNLAEKNNLSVGDSITISYEGQEETFRIRGIYEANEIPQAESESMEGYYTDSQESFIFCDYESFTRLTQMQDCSILMFYLDDYTNMEECLAHVQSIVSEVETPSVVLDVISQNTLQMSDVFVMLDRMNGVVLIGTYLLCIAIMTLMVILWLRTHRETIAIYRTLGQQNAKTVAMIVCEIAAVTIPAMFLSLASGVYLISANAYELLQKLLEWCGINTVQQSFALSNWDDAMFGMDMQQLLRQVGLIMGVVLLAAFLASVWFVRMPMRKLRV